MNEELKNGKIKKPWYKRWWAIAIYIIIGLGILSNLSNNNSNESKSAKQVDSQTKEANSAPQTTTTTTLPPTTTTTRAKQWTNVITLSGNSEKRSQVFELIGGQTKLSYTVSKSSMPVCTIYVLEEGTSLEKDGGFPEVSIDKAGSDSTFLTKEAGRYYLDVKAANCNWIVTIEEEK